MLTFFSCKEDGTSGDSNTGNSENTDGTDNKKPEMNVICIWNAVSLKKEANEKGKYITTMYLGEVGKTYGETITDSSTSKPKEYIKIKLADGTEGWIQKNLVAVDSKSYAVKSRTKLYQRPDILSSTKKELDFMQFVIVTETQEEWLKVKGKKIEDTWFTEGWVKLENVTENEIDVTVAALAERAAGETDVTKKLNALNEILGNPDLESSIFIERVREMVSEITGEGDYEEYGD